MELEINPYWQPSTRCIEFAKEMIDNQSEYYSFYPFAINFLLLSVAYFLLKTEKYKYLKIVIILTLLMNVIYIIGVLIK